MNCFNHRDKPAIGLCKSCGKGLCGDCLTELPNGLACKGSCEKRVDALNRIADSDAETKIAARRRLWVIGVRSFFVGICFGLTIAAIGVMTYFDKDNPRLAFLAYLIVLGACLAFGVVGAIYDLLTGIFRLKRKMRDLRIKEKTQ